jgi:prostatic aicd phosphatase
MNIQSIHNVDFAKALPSAFLVQARDLANWHEYGIFSSPQLTGIENSASVGSLPQNRRPYVIEPFSCRPDYLTLHSQWLREHRQLLRPTEVLYQAIAYKPFISLFNMTGVAQLNPELAGIGWSLLVHPLCLSVVLKSYSR